MGATTAAAAILADMIELSDPNSLPNDLEALWRCHGIAEDLLVWFSDTLEQTWDQAEARRTEMVRLQELQAALLAKAAAQAAEGLGGIRRKLLLWQRVVGEEPEAEDYGAAQALVHSVIRDLDALCGWPAEETPARSH